VSFLTGTLLAWLGHATFVITTVAGVNLLIDPMSPMVGYPLKDHSVRADVIFVSHNHPDHNYTDLAISAENVVKPKAEPGYQEGEFGYTQNGKPGKIKFRRIFAYHDGVEGKERGPDTITVINADGIRFCHLGDFGQPALTKKQLELIGGPVDVLMIPVGGFYTIDGKQAAVITEQLHPKVIYPMHYLTKFDNPDLQTKLHPVSEYLTAMQGKATVVTGDAERYALAKDRLPAKPTIVLLSLPEVRKP
jgi:L-ascorbate metabolism protein UlaG (beta-lactamase superfamily)